MTKRSDMNAKYAKVDAKYGKTLGASKGAAKVSSKPKITASGTKPAKKQIGIKAKWTF